MVLPPPRPLRTVHETFAAYGSSTSNPRLSQGGHTKSCDLGNTDHGVPSARGHNRTRTWRSRYSRLPIMVLPVRTRWKSARFRVRSRLNLYPHHYSVAFAFSTVLYPHSHRPTLRLPTQKKKPLGTGRGLPRSLCLTGWG